MPYKSRILAIDGGGIRGILPSIILSEIEKRTGKRIFQLFNLIAGTSTGGLVACGLTKPNPNAPKESHYTAEELIEIYRKDGKDIFYEPPFERLSRVDDIIRPKFSSKGRDKVVTQYLGDTPLEDALTEVFITSYDIELRAPIFFVSKPGKEETKSRTFRKICSGFTMRQASMATSAAPSYFEPFQVPTAQTEKGYYALIDGGVFANNPTSLAVMETIIDKKRADQKLDLDDILVVSLGTGSLTRRYHYDMAKNWGLVGWVEPLLNIIFDGSSESVAVQLEQLLPKAQNNPPQYYRFQAFLNEANDDIDVADSENIEKLEELARQIIAERNQDLDELCQQLVEPLEGQ